MLKLIKIKINSCFLLLSMVAGEPDVYEQILHTRGLKDNDDDKKKKKKKKGKKEEKGGAGGMGLQLLFGGKGWFRFSSILHT